LQSGKITLRQFIFLFAMSIFSPAIRLFPQITSSGAGAAAWVVPLIAGIAFIGFILVMTGVFRKNDDNFSDLLEKSFGKTIGKGLQVVYFIWIVFLTGLYVRYYAERLLSSIMPECSKEFLIVAILILVYFTARGHIAGLARMNEFVFPLFLVMLAVLAGLIAFDLNINNLYPITAKQMLPMLGAGGNILGIWGYFAFTLFFVHRVQNKDKLRSMSVKGALILIISAVVIVVITVGSLGAPSVKKISQPFFGAVKNISALGPLSRVEPIVISMWIITDFIIIALFTCISLYILQSLCKLPSKKEFAGPIVLLIFVVSLFITGNAFELEAFSTNIALPMNQILCLGLPLSAVVVGKIRKTI